MTKSPISHISHPDGDPRQTIVRVHPGMTTRQTAAMRTGGLGHPTGSGAQPGSVLDHPPQLKIRTPPAIHPGMRSKIADTPHAAPAQNHAAGTKRTLDQRLGEKIRDAASHVAGSHIVDHDCCRD